MKSSFPPAKPAGLNLALVALATATASAAFYLNPWIDLAFSHYFFDGQHFPLRHNGLLQTLRQANFWAGAVVVFFSMALTVSRRLRSAFGVSLRHALIPLITYGLGVGLIVNLVLKETFGRARPRDTLGLGGDQSFSAVWEISEACASNCSFTSGEAAGAMAMLSVLYLIPAEQRALRRFSSISLGLLAGALSLNRIAFGGHYLSDTILSILIVSLVMIAAKLVLDTAPFLAPRPRTRRRRAIAIKAADRLTFTRTQQGRSR